MTTKSEWEQANRELLAQLRAKLGDPPTAEEMLAYSRGELSEEQAARVRELLVAYPDLARAYTEPFPDAPQPGDADYLSDEEVAASWEALKQRRAAANAPSRARILSFRSMPTAIAAVLALVFAGLFAQAEMRARRYQEELSRPLVVGDEVKLSPSTPTRGGEEPPKTVETDGGAYRFAPRLSGVREFYGHYRIEIVDRADQRVMWSDTTAKRRRDDSFDLIVPRRFLPPGDYEIRISGIHHKDHLLGVFDFRIPR